MILKPDQQPLVVETVNDWLEQAVIGLGLCPFAQSAKQRQAIRFVISDATRGETLLLDLFDECRYLEENEITETTLLICSFGFKKFDAFNQFLGYADELIDFYLWRGVFQIASFHPDYQFAETMKTDRENWTNRSPFPILHILRESSLDRAIAGYPSVETIPDRNIECLRALDDAVFTRIFNRDNKTQ